MSRSMFCLAAFSAGLALGGCDMVKLTVGTTSKVLVRAKPSMEQESDPDLARAALPGTLKTIEGFLVAAPGNERLIKMLSESYCQYATGFVQDDWEVALSERRFEDGRQLAVHGTKLYTRCVNYALKELGGSWEKAVFGEYDDLAKQVKKAGKGSLHGMLWLGIGLASSINLNRDNIGMVSYLPKARLLLERIVELDGTYSLGLPHMALGMINAAVSPAMGGKPDLAKEHFEKAIAVTDGKFLLARVMYARHYGVITQNREFFRKTLVTVLQTSPAIYPEQRLANELAHRRARRYLKQEKEFF